MTRRKNQRGTSSEVRFCSAARITLLACFLSVAFVGCDAGPSEFMPESDSDSTLFKTYQPNGKAIQLYYRGDVYFSWYEDEAGYTVLRKSGAYYYAQLNGQGELVVTEWLVGSVNPSAVGLRPGILPSAEVINRIRAASTVKPISYAAPDPSLIREGFMVVEGDMVLPTAYFEQQKMGASASVYVTNRLWTNGVVPYEFDANVTSGNQAAMRQAMDDWEAVADVQFVVRTNQANYVHIFSGSGNWSYVGMIGGRQDLCIYNWNYEFIMAHELAHAMCYWHEHSRSDRDTFVQINWGNIESGKENNFDIHHAWNDADAGSYDFDSVMHYGAYSFSNNGQPTIITQPAYAGTSFGQRTHLSVGDAQNMAVIYGTSVPTDKSEMTTPANNGDSLTGASFTFSWDAGSGVIEYWMWIGSQANTYNILNQSQGLNLSKTVTGLPTNGSNLYVRIFSLINGNWEYNSYTYSCVNIPVDKAEMTTPTNDGDSLTGASFTFEWDAGSGVTEYWMWIGSQINTYDFLNQSQGSNLSKTVTGLPTNGSNLYVHIFSLINGNWEYNSYTYSCVDIPVDKAEMTTPTNDGDSLTGASFTFEWDAGSGVTEYWMWIGSQADTYDMLNESQGSNLSKTFTGLPTDGSNLYVRIFSLINGNWEYNSYTYSCVDIPVDKAEMTTPTNDGDTLTGASFTLEWDAGSGVTEYWMWIGSQVNTYDILNQSQGLNLSKTLAGLPTDGSNLYVRIFSLINGNWEYNSYTYSCVDIPVDKAEMTTPTNNGDSLTGSTFTFEWDAGSGITEYWMWIGSQVNTYDILNQSQGMNISKTVTGLPTNGSNLYVRIFSLINGNWEYNAYTYTTANLPSVKAAMTNPVSDGAYLNTSSFTFHWNAGTNVTEYWLWLGSSPGTYDILNESQGLNLSKTVSGLATDGRLLYVRVFSMIDGDWQYHAYTYHTGSN